MIEICEHAIIRIPLKTHILWYVDVYLITDHIPTYGNVILETYDYLIALDQLHEWEGFKALKSLINCFTEEVHNLSKYICIPDW